MIIRVGITENTYYKYYSIQIFLRCEQFQFEPGLLRGSSRGRNYRFKKPRKKFTKNQCNDLAQLSCRGKF